MDYNATTPIYHVIKDAIIPYLTEYWGNPSLSQWAGYEPKKAMQTAREIVFNSVNASNN